MKLSETILNHVYTSLYGLKDGVSAQVQTLAVHYGVTTQTIYRWAGMKGLRWRKEKTDKGKSKVSTDVVKLAGALLYVSKRKRDQITIPACDAKEMLEDSGIETGGVSTSRFIKLMKVSSVSAADILRPSPHQKLLSKHPNHVWQFDVTNCLQYFLNEKGLGERDPDMELYKNKIVKTAKGIKKELLRYVAVDHCTGAFYFRYFYASGERAIDGSQFLYEAMRPKDEIIQKIWNGSSDTKKGKYHFHGVPFTLVCDRGSIAAAKANQALLQALKVKLEPHMPGNPRAKGAVEGLMKIINRFEGRLKFQRPENLEQLNMWALDWGIMYNGAREMRDSGSPRSALWSMITKEQLRLCPDEKLYRMLIREPEITRTADGARLISVDNKHYQIPDPNAVNQKVIVVRHPYEYPAVEAHFNGFVWLLQPIPHDIYGRLTVGVEYGEYKAIKYTDAQKAKKEMEQIAQEEWGLSWKGTGDKRIAVAPPAGQVSPLNVFGSQADKVKVDFISRKGTELEIEPPEMPENKPVKTDAAEVGRGIIARRIPFMQFLKDLKDAIGIISQDLNRQLREKYGESIEIREAEEVIERISKGEWQENTVEQLRVEKLKG